MSEMLMRVYQFMSQSGVCLKRNSSILAHEAGAGEEAVSLLGGRVHLCRTVKSKLS